MFDVQTAQGYLMLNPPHVGWLNHVETQHVGWLNRADLLGERDLTASSSGANCRDPPEEEKRRENAGDFSMDFGGVHPWG